VRGGGARPGPGPGDLPHVREVEQAGRAADGPVLGDLTAVPQRHQPAREAGHRGAEAFVDRAQRGWPGLTAGWLLTVGWLLVGRHHLRGPPSWSLPVLAWCGPARPDYPRSASWPPPRPASGSRVAAWSCSATKRLRQRWPGCPTGPGRATASPGRWSSRTSRQRCSLPGRWPTWPRRPTITRTS